MRYHCKVVLALLVCTAIGASSQNGFAQDRANYRFAQKASPTPARGAVEEMPLGQPNAGTMAAPSDSSGYVDGGMTPNHPYPGGFEEGGEYPGCPCDTCDGCPCGEPCDMGGCGSGCCGLGGGKWFVTGDYLNVRAHVSDALAFVQQERATTTDSDFTTQTFHQLEYDYESSFRVGGGYRLCCCGDEIRFMFTRLNSSADANSAAVQQPTTTVIIPPFVPAPLSFPATLAVRSSVDVESYDLEFRKTIPLGGSCSSCGECCQSACPAWDIVWSGGVRGATVELDRSYTVAGDPTNVENNGTTTSSVQFDGAGLRTGLEGRRYFGHDGWFSVFVKGDLSILLGELDVNTERRLTDGAAPDTRIIEALHTQQIIPVTELEAGITASVTCHSTFSAGYMLSAWHDLGFRDEPFRANVQDVNSYDDANILGFDGFFARYEFGF